MGIFNRLLVSTERGFYWWGTTVSLRPWIGVLVAALVAIILAPGYTILEVENRGDKLWVPGGTRAQEDKAYVEEETNFASDSRVSQFIIASADDLETGNILTPDVLTYALQIHNKVLGITFDYVTADTEVEHKGLTYADDGDDDDSNDFVCVETSPGTCYHQSLLSFFTTKDENGASVIDPSMFDTEEKILAVVNSIDPDDTENNPLRYSVESLLGGIQRKEQSDEIVAASAISINYLISAEVVSQDGDDLDPRSDAFEEAFLDVVEAETEEITANDSTISIERVTNYSFDTEFDAVMSDDLNVFVVALLLIFLYCLLQLSILRKGLVGLRLVSTIGGFIGIGLAVLVSQGLAGYFGLFSSSLINILPFLLVGIGVDDLFVITNAFDKTARDPDSPDLPTRLARALAEGGVSITLTSVTNFGAFLIGSNTSLPGLRNFSLYAAFGILFDYFFSLVLYPAFLVWDAKR